MIVAWTLRPLERKERRRRNKEKEEEKKEKKKGGGGLGLYDDSFYVSSIRKSPKCLTKFIYILCT